MRGSMKSTIIQGRVYILGDNIDTDQIISAEYLKINPSTDEGRSILGELAMCGLPLDAEPFRDDYGNALYSIIIAGDNFGCGSSREHAVVALAACGIKAILAKSFARIFYRNSIVSGELLPLTFSSNILPNLKNGDNFEINTQKNKVIVNYEKEINIDPIGDMASIVNHGGIFNYARHLKMFKVNENIIDVKNINV